MSTIPHYVGINNLLLLYIYIYIFIVMLFTTIYKERVLNNVELQYIYIYIYIYINARSRFSHHEEECSTVWELLRYSEIYLFTHFLAFRSDLFRTPAMSTHQASFVSSGQRSSFVGGVFCVGGRFRKFHFSYLIMNICLII